MEKRTFVPREILQQQDNQTCMPCCLLMWYSQEFPDEKIDFKKQEMKLDIASFGLYREYYALAHTAAFTRMFPNVGITIYVDNQDFTKQLSILNKEERIKVIYRRVTTQWLKREISKNPVILSVDSYYLKGATVHIPHYIYLFQGEQGNTQTVDPAYGEVRSISDKELEDGFVGLKYHMLWSPIVIRPEKRTI